MSNSVIPGGVGTPKSESDCVWMLLDVAVSVLGENRLEPNAGCAAAPEAFPFPAGGAKTLNTLLGGVVVFPNAAVDGFDANRLVAALGCVDAAFTPPDHDAFTSARTLS